MDCVCSAGRFEIKRIVVRFRDPKNSSASLRVVEVTDPQSGKLLKVETLAQGDRSSYESLPPSAFANAWRLPEYKPPITVNSATVVHLEIGSGLNIDPGGSGPPTPNYQPPPGSPLILLSVDVYVKNPDFGRSVGNESPKIDSCAGGVHASPLTARICK